MDESNNNSAAKKVIYTKTNNKPKRFSQRFPRWIVYGIGLVVLVGAAILAFFPTFRQNLRQTVPSPTPVPEKQQPQITLGKTKVTTEVARTNEEREKGLSGRESLPKDGGMLFVFETPDRHSFWMKGMRFPLDIIWIANGKVVGFEENLPVPAPQTTDADLPSYLPRQPISAALEVNAGFVQENNIQIDDPVKLSNLEPSI